MSDDVLEVMHELRAFMFERVYLRPGTEEQRSHAMQVVRTLVDHFGANPSEMPEGSLRPGDSVEENVIDFVAGMTDRYALRVFDSLQGGYSAPRGGPYNDDGIDAGSAGSTNGGGMVG